MICHNENILELLILLTFIVGMGLGFLWSYIWRKFIKQNKEVIEK